MQLFTIKSSFTNKFYGNNEVKYDITKLSSVLPAYNRLINIRCIMKALW